ncbi:MAG: 30S ribosomal protein S6 [Deltaproteobacteria bacterium]|nr:30S ribosomal protein S6 [Deltaproteobacteria bacterium]
MREYESIYVLNPEVTDAKARDFMIKMKDLVNREGGKSIKVDCWGRRKLAWERNKYQRGIYVNHRYLGNPGLVAEYQRTLDIDESVLLRQSVLLKKDVDASSQEEQADQLEIPVVRERRESQRFHQEQEGSSDAPAVVKQEQSEEL